MPDLKVVANKDLVFYSNAALDAFWWDDDGNCVDAEFEKAPDGRQIIKDPEYPHFLKYAYSNVLDDCWPYKAYCMTCNKGQYLGLLAEIGDPGRVRNPALLQKLLAYAAGLPKATGCSVVVPIDPDTPFCQWELYVLIKAEKSLTHEKVGEIAGIMEQYFANFSEEAGQNTDESREQESQRAEPQEMKYMLMSTSRTEKETLYQTLEQAKLVMQDELVKVLNMHNGSYMPSDCHIGPRSAYYANSQEFHSWKIVDIKERYGNVVVTKLPKEPPAIVTATYVSNWDWCEVAAPCKVNMQTREVFDIETADIPEGVLEALELLTGEYVEFSDKTRYEVLTAEKEGCLVTDLSDVAAAKDMYWRE